MATAIRAPTARLPRDRPRPLARPRIVPECTALLSENDTANDATKHALPAPAEIDHRAKNALVCYSPKPGPTPGRARARLLGAARNPRAPRAKAVQPHRNALSLHRPSAGIVRRSLGAPPMLVAPKPPTRVSMDETRSVIEAAVREAHLDRYMVRADVLREITWHLRRRGYANSVIELLMQTSYRLFDVDSVYYGTFEKQTVCVCKDGDWVPYEVTRYHLFDGFQAFRINDQQCVERVSINNHVQWKWPE
jgi:hypothetical protein